MKKTLILVLAAVMTLTAMSVFAGGQQEGDNHG